MLGSLLRVNQWYKNLLIFLPLFFVQEIFEPRLIFLAFLGFLALCCVSSSGYIINDIIDREKDRFHPEKKLRPIAAEKIGVFAAALLSLLLLIIAISLASFLHPLFLAAVICIFVLMQLYSFFLKNEAFADIIVIATNFVLRAASGAFIIQKTVSPWLILCVFFLSLFLSSGKRKADLMFLKKAAALHKKTLNAYSLELADVILGISTTSLILSYSLFSFLSIHPYLIFSLPFALYTVFYYVYLVYSHSPIARRPELVVKDYRMVIGMGLWLLTTLTLVYL